MLAAPDHNCFAQFLQRRLNFIYRGCFAAFLPVELEQQNFAFRLLCPQISSLRDEAVAVAANDGEIVPRIVGRIAVDVVFLRHSMCLGSPPSGGL
jgi:hypothetical protein